MSPKPFGKSGSSRHLTFPDAFRLLGASTEQEDKHRLVLIRGGRIQK